VSKIADAYIDVNRFLEADNGPSLRSRKIPFQNAAEMARTATHREKNRGRWFEKKFIEHLKQRKIKFTHPKGKFIFSC